jgi:uncharacterized protein (TIGR02246 family)
MMMALTSIELFALDARDRQDIEDIVNHFADAWNNNQGNGIADDYAQDADFVNIAGMAFSGKQEIQQVHNQFHKTSAKGSNFQITNLKIREVKPDVAIVHVNWTLSNIQTPGQQRANPGTMKGIFTHVLVKNNGKWEIQSSQNTLQPN